MAQIRSVKTETRLADWVRRLSNASSEPTRAIDLYCGDHWHVIKSLVETRTGQNTSNLWVASAGWGFINCTDKITSYGATFTSSEPDSVIHSKISPKESLKWWDGLIQSNLPRRKSPTSFAALAREASNVPMLVALSPTYLAAVREDLVAARSELDSPELLIVISAGTKKDAILSSNLIPCDTRLQLQLGGSLTSLNARVLRFILEKYPRRELRAQKLIHDFEKLNNETAKRPISKRTTMSDAEVSVFITKLLETKQTNLSHSSLLRAFRSLGNACEQSRFREIFRNVIQSLEKE
jgi:hypothetical protein